jgi:cytochrome c oxidase cbb3-type subunit 3
VTQAGRLHYNDSSMMQLKHRTIAAALFLLWALALTRAEPVQTPATQPPPAQTPPTQAPQEPPAGRGAGRGTQPGTFPAQQRPPGDPALIERGKSVYSASCTACHGADLRGGQLGGPNLLRSLVVLNDQAGELILPIVRGSRAERGMPPLPIPDDDVRAVAEYIHAVLATSGRQGGPPGTAAPAPNVVIGEPAAGEKYFQAKCSSCHSPTGDLQGIATRIPDAKALQTTWVSGGAVGGRGRGAGQVGRVRKPVTVTVTQPSGEKVTGNLVRIDHFIVTLAREDGTFQSFRRNGDTPKVQIDDPLAGHKALWSVLTEKDIHDTTAYLVTLK